MTKKLIKRILEISYKHKLSHLSSCISCVDLIYKIYKQKRDDEVFILSNGHAGLALYVVLEHFYNIDAEMLLEKHGIHPSRDLQNKIFCSTGSLGSGLPIAVGHALADKSKDVYCIISDGECAEGSIWESLSFVHTNRIDNLKIYVNINGYSATKEVDEKYLVQKLDSFSPRNKVNLHFSNHTFDFLNGIDGHYHTMNKEEYEKALCQID